MTAHPPIPGHPCDLCTRRMQKNMYFFFILNVSLYWKGSVGGGGGRKKFEIVPEIVFRSSSLTIVVRANRHNNNNNYIIIILLTVSVVKVIGYNIIRANCRPPTGTVTVFTRSMSNNFPMTPRVR